MNPKNIALSGGGTGGHVFPVEAVATYIHTHLSDAHTPHQLFWYGENNSLEAERAAALTTIYGPEMISFVPVRSGKYRRKANRREMLQNLVDLGMFALGMIGAMESLYTNDIDVVFCKGGYVALPVVIAAWILHIPIVTHESDTSAGLVNRISGRLGTHNFSAFPDVLPHTQVVGQLLGSDMLAPCDDAQIHAFLDRYQHRPKILVVGGSQGSESLYLALLDQLESGNETGDVAYIVALGRLNTHLASRFDRFEHVLVRSFFSKPELGLIMSASDSAITRGGTTFLAELKLFGLKLVIIPIPWTHDQEANAQWYVSHHADISLDQESESFSSDLADAVAGLSEYKKTPRTVGIEELEDGVRVVSERLVG